MGLDHTQPQSVSTTPGLPQIFGAAKAARAGLIAAARKNYNVFAELVLKDPATGKGIKQAPHHIEWNRLCLDHPRLILQSSVELGKSAQVIVGRTLWNLGRNPNMRLAIIGATHTAAQKLVRSIASYIETSAELHEVFPDLVPDRTQVWTDSRITVKRPNIGPDPSLVCFGTEADGIIGSRWDGLLLDDILTYDNTRTVEGRKKIYDWIMGTLLSRLTDGAFMTVIGNVFHPDDALHRLAQLPGWVCRKYPVYMDDGVTPRWPERWPVARIEERRSQLPPHEFARQMLCQPRSAADAIFKEEWIKTALHRGYSQGMLKPTHSIVSLPPGCKTVTGVDLAISQKDAADSTAICTIMGRPTNDRVLLDAVYGKWDANTIVHRIIDIQRRYNSIVVVENNAGQDFLRQMLVNAAPHMPIFGYTTTASAKNHQAYGVAAMSNEFAKGMWLFPNDNGVTTDAIRQLISELQGYDPNAHTGDLCMSLWLAREGLRKYAAPSVHFGYTNHNPMRG